MRIRKAPGEGIWTPFSIFTALLLAASFVAQAARAQDSDEAPAPTDVAPIEAAPIEAAPIEVAVIGASVSNGFVCPWSDDSGRKNATVKLGKALKSVYGSDRFKIRDRSDLATFMDPVRVQTKLVERSVRKKPQLVFAVDFMFWFGYGYVRGGDEGRLGLQKQGLELLESFGGVPIIVGDYPNMAGADPRMLRKGQIPSPDVLKKLNKSLHEWADKRSHVVVFPLDAWVTELKTVGRKVEVDGQPVQLAAEDLLQTDKLHASKLGMAVLVLGLSEVVAKLDPARFAVANDVSFQSVVDAIRADVELEEIMDAQAEPAAGK